MIDLSLPRLEIHPAFQGGKHIRARTVGLDVRRQVIVAGYFQFLAGQAVDGRPQGFRLCRGRKGKRHGLPGHDGRTCQRNSARPGIVELHAHPAGLHGYDGVRGRQGKASEFDVRRVGGEVAPYGRQGKRPHLSPSGRSVRGNVFLACLLQGLLDRIYINAVGRERHAEGKSLVRRGHGSGQGVMIFAPGHVSGVHGEYVAVGVENKLVHRGRDRHAPGNEQFAARKASLVSAT